MWFLVSIAMWLAAAAAWGDEAEAVAAEAIERHRDAKHRAEVQLIWPLADPEETPRDLDVLLITDGDCLRFHRADGGPVVCERIARPRAAPDGGDGAAFEARRVEIDPGRFDVAWNAACRLLAARAELVNPPPGPAVILGADGEVVDMIARLSSMSVTGGAGTPVEWLRIRTGDGAPLAAVSFSGETRHDDILDFDQLRDRGIRQVFLDLAKKTPPDAGEPFPLGECTPWLAAELAHLPPATARGDLDRFTRVFFEVALPILGDTAGETTLATIEAFREHLASRAPNAPATRSLNEEADRAVERVNLGRNWDSAAASGLIHGQANGRRAGGDQERRLRRMFRERDPSAYADLLRSDLRSPDDRLMRTSIEELAGFRPEGWIGDLHPLLDSGNAEVACDTAFALLGVDRRHWHSDPGRNAVIAAAAEAATLDDRLADAWRRIERLATDPGVVAPPSWWGGARDDALELLVSPDCPQPWHWDRQRVMRQLENGTEKDPRMLASLLRRLGFNVSARPRQRPAPEDREFLVRIWRRGLGEPYNVGTAKAIEQLVTCGDTESRPEIHRILDELEKGCRQEPGRPAAIPERFWWITFGEIGRLREYVDGMP